MLALYGHPFSSYTWKALIPLYANGTPFDFRVVDADHPEHAAMVNRAGPAGKFPVLEDGATLVFEATSIIEYLQRRYPGPELLLPENPDAAIGMRMLDRVFDNYVMAPVQAIVDEHIRAPDAVDRHRVEEARQRLSRSYAWLERWLENHTPMTHITLVECAAAPSLFYADWVHPIGDAFPRLAAWRAHLLRHPAVARCVDDARPWRQYFPPGAPDRD